MPSTYEYVIVGGGVHGCALAYELAKRGREVLLIEKSTVASGASGGFGHRGVRANHRNLEDLPLMESVYRRWSTLAEELGEPTGYSRKGGLFLFEREATGSMGGMVSMELRAAIQNAHGVPTEILNSEQLAERLPGMNPRVKAALYCPNDGTADQTATTRAYAAAAQRLGAVLWEQSEVVSAEITDGKLKSISLADGREVIASRRLILTTNGDSPQFLARLFGVRLPLWTVYPQALTLSVTEEELDLRGYLVAHDSRSMSLKRLDQETVMLSGGWRGKYNKQLRRAEPDENEVKANIDAASQVFPALAQAQLRQAATDRPECASFDRVAIIDELPQFPQVAVATGWSGSGFATAPAIAELTAEWFTSGIKPSQLNPFSIDRFPALAPADTSVLASATS